MLIDQFHKVCMSSLLVALGHANERLWSSRTLETSMLSSWWFWFIDWARRLWSYCFTIIIILNMVSRLYHPICILNILLLIKQSLITLTIRWYMLVKLIIRSHNSIPIWILSCPSPHMASMPRLLLVSMPILFNQRPASHGSLIILPLNFIMISLSFSLTYSSS